MTGAVTGAVAPRSLVAGRAAPQRRFHGVVLLAGVGFGLTAPYTALLVTALGGHPSWAAYVVSSMGLSLLLVDVTGTRFVPRLESRAALTTSMLVFGAGSALSAVTTSWAVVGLARVLQGFGAALFMGGGVLLAVRLADDARHGGAIGSFNALWFAGVAVGPLGGGLVASLAPGADGLRLLFGVCAAVNVIGAVAAWTPLPRSPSVLRPRLGLPRGLGVRGGRRWAVLVLAGLGQALRSGLAMTLVPLLGERLGLGWVPLGLALFALAVTDVGVMHFGSRWADRRGRTVPLALALAWGALVTAGLALTGDPVLFTLGALAVGATVGAAWVLPVAMTVDLAGAGDREPALAAYRIASDVGMLAGGLFAGGALALGGLGGALLATATVQVAGLVLTLAVGETAPRPAPSLPDPPLEEPVPLPPIEQFTLFATNQDIDLTPERLAQAYTAHTRYREDLERLRALPLPFTEPVTEPATALAWLERGGRA